MTFDNKAFAKAIKSKMDYGDSMRSVAKVAGISVSTICRVLQGKDAKVSTILAICHKWLFMPITDFITGVKLIMCVAEIAQVSTGQYVEMDIKQPMKPGEPHPSIFNWKENNFSCDCNRRNFFYQALGGSFNSESPCSEGEFLVNLRVKETGEVFYKEFDRESYYLIGLAKS